MSEVKNIPEGWVETTLEIISNKVTDGSHQSPKSVQDGMPMLSVKDMNEFGFDISNSKKISKKDYDFLVKQGCKPNVNDILIAKDGSVLKHIFRVKEEINAVLLSSIAIITPNELKINPSYLGYILINPNFKKYILNNFLSGSGVPRIVLKDFKKIEFTIPKNLKEQKSIADILTAFDNKIELLQAQNKTLEETAQTIFKEWFGKYQIEDELPEGWSKVKIKDFNVIVTDFVANGSFASLAKNVKYKAEPDYAKLIRLTDYNNGFNGEFVYVDKIAYDFLNKSKLLGGEIIISNVGAYAGTVFKCPQLNSPMTLGPNSIVLKSNFSNYFFLMFSSRTGKHFLDSIITGSAQPKFNKTAFRNLELSFPNLDYLIKFETIVNPFMEKIEQNKNQVQTLTKTRDELLPKLMSGEVRVNEFKV